MNPHSRRTPKPYPGSTAHSRPGRDAGRDPSRDLDRILTALGDTQPPTNLEHRILQRLEQLNHLQQPEPSPAGLPLSPAFTSLRAHLLAWSLTLSAATLVLAIFALSTHRAGGPTTANLRNSAPAPGATTFSHPPSNSVIISSRPTSNSVILSEGSRSFTARAAVEGPVLSVPKEPRSSPRHPNLQYLSHREPQNPPQLRARSHTLLCDCDPTAVAEANAPSHPAPPLPLTEQEKLLLRIAHHPDAIELAELDPSRREAAIARDQAAYQHFFHLPGPEATPPPEAALETTPAPATEAVPPPQPPTPTATPNGDQP